MSAEGALSKETILLNELNWIATLYEHLFQNVFQYNNTAYKL